MRFKIYILFLVLVICYVSGYAQTSTPLTGADFTKLNEVLPPSPTTFELGKYGGINAASISGAVSKQIPLFTYRAGNLNLPIALSYTSNGIKVDQIPTRTGMSWSLEIGGMISRTVYGKPDELGQPLPVPSDLTTPSEELFNFFTAASASNSTFDLQPDIYSFNFNGSSGKFVISNGMVKLVTHSNIKIEQNIENYDFRVTVSNGDKYYFGGTGAIESSRNDNNCGIHNPQYIKNAWYLSKIVAYTGEVINFTYGQGTSNYQTGVNQVMMRKISANCTLCPGLATLCNDIPDQTCQSYVSNHFVYLTNITSSVTGSIKLYYTSREDVYGEYLLSKIKSFSSADSSVLLKTYNLDYLKAVPGNGSSPGSLDIRYFLKSLSEVSGNGTESHSHTFAYDDVYGLPSRCSYSQDYYGCYNGKANSSMIPKFQTLEGFPTDLADRSPDWNFAKKGLLTRINYPTGGADSISYEPNTTYGVLVTPAPVFQINISGMGSGTRSGMPKTSSTFSPQLSQEITIESSCQYTGQDTPDPNILPYLKVRTELLDLTNNQTTTIRESTYIGEDYRDNVQVTGGHNYTIRITPYGGNTMGNVTTYYRNTNPVSTMTNLPQAGLRVARVITLDNKGGSPAQIKQIYYGGGADFQPSTGVTSFGPDYYALIKTQDACPVSQGDGSGNYLLYNCEYNALYSNSVNTTYLQDGPVQYKQVTESDGENFDNGGVSHVYLTDQDTPGQVIWGERITSAPLSNFGIMNGLEVQTSTLAKNGTQLIRTKTNTTHYKVATSPAFEIKAYVINKKYNAAPLSGTNAPAVRLAQFDALSYSVFGEWFYPDTVTTVSYDSQGLNPITEITVYAYNNYLHALPSTIKTQTSNGKSDLITYQYPPDVSTIAGLDVSQVSILNALSSVNRISQPVKVVKTLNNAPVFAAKTHYRTWPSNLIQPDSVTLQNSAYTPEQRVQFYNYDIHGNLLEQSKTSGIHESYQWGYNAQYPVAQAINARSNDIFYDSFEEGNGNSGLNDSKTGHYSHSGAYSKPLSGLDAGNYELTYWQKSGTVWTFVKSPVTISSNSYTISLNAQIDDVRFYPKDAQMTTYTYDPLVGMTSMTDAKGETTTYEYDSFQRLMNVKDKDGNIVKYMDYHYQGQ